MTAEPPRGPAIRCDELSLHLGGARLLERVSLHVAPGTLHCLVGANGAGKTSLLRCLLGQAPHTGRITLAWPAMPGAIGYVPQTLDFDRTLPVTVEDFLALGAASVPVFAGVRAAQRVAIDAALAAVGMGAHRRSLLGRLSGGELKRVVLAQALTSRPALLVLDEPMNHLDAPAVAQVTTLLRGLRDGGATVLCCLHDLAQVRALADAVTGLRDGRVVFSGAPEAVLTPENLLRTYAGEAAA